MWNTYTTFELKEHIASKKKEHTLFSVQRKYETHLTHFLNRGGIQVLFLLVKLSLIHCHY